MAEHRFAAVERKIRSALVEYSAPSLAVAVAQHGKILWQQGYGWADRATRRPATEHTPYLLASVTKPITATAIMRLVEMGKLDLDAPINTYLAPHCPLKVWIGEEKDVTVRRVASHSAGLPLHSNGYGAKEQRPPTDESIRRYGNIVTPPGERYCYSNIGYGILDYLVERVSGMSFGDFLRHEVFLPLGMNSSFVGGDPDFQQVRVTLYDEGNRPAAMFDTDHRGATMAFCSVHDLLRFGMFHGGQPLPDQRAILSPANLAQMQQPVVSMNLGLTADPNLRQGSSYGIGWVVDDDELDFRVSHGGGFTGSSTKLTIMPRAGIVIATASNYFCPLAYTLEEDILAELVPGFTQKLEAHRQRRKQAEAAPAPTDPWPCPELLGQWTGEVHTYQQRLPLVLRFLEDGQVHAKLGDQLWTLVNEVTLRNGRLTGRMQGTTGTDEVLSRPRHPFHHLRLALTLRGSKLNGALMAIASREVGQWVELTRG